MRFVVLFAVPALVAAACGEGADDGAATTAPVTTSPVTTTPITTSAPGSDADALAGTSWVAISLASDAGPVSLVMGREPTIEFGTDGAGASGSTGCNTYSGAVSIGGGTIRFSQIAVTERACLEPEIMQIEAAFLAVLGGLTSLSLANGILELSGPEGSIGLIVPVPVVDSPLEGTRWSLETVSDGVAATSVLSSTSPGLVVEGDSIRGTTGCNDFGGELTVAGESFVVGSLTWTEIGCEANVMDQEASILDVLSAADRYEIEGDRLTIYAGARFLSYRATG